MKIFSKISIFTKMKNPHHAFLLKEIRKQSGRPKKNPFLNNYLGNTHPLYDIRTPALRKIARDFNRTHGDKTVREFESLLTSLITGESATEKMFAGILLDQANKDLRPINPKLFDQWLDHLEGWAEVDAVCTGSYTKKQLPQDWDKWEPLLQKFSKSKNIQKRRASLVLLCGPLRHLTEKRFLYTTLDLVDRLKTEKHVLITKAVSWALRSAVKNHREEIAEYLEMNEETLPSIAVRETRKVLETGRKTKRRED